MPTTTDAIVANTQPAEHKLKSGEAQKAATKDEAKNEPKEDQEPKPQPDHAKEQFEEIPVETEAKTGVSFPVRLDDGKQLKAVGLRKKSMLGMGIKIYAFGMYADTEKLKALLIEKFGKAPAKPTKEMYQMVIDSDIGMRVRLVIVFSSLTMSMVRKNFDEGLGAAIKKLTGARNDELTKKIMGEAATDDIKLSPGSMIEISIDPGYVLQATVAGEVVSKVESELLCRAFMYLYLGEDPFDKEAKEKFGNSMLTLF